MKIKEAWKKKVFFRGTWAQYAIGLGRIDYTSFVKFLFFGLVSLLSLKYGDLALGIAIGGVIFVEIEQGAQNRYDDGNYLDFVDMFFGLTGILFFTKILPLFILLIYVLIYGVQ